MNKSSNVVIKVEKLSKRYRLGVISHRTLYRAIQTKWSKWTGKEDPNSLITDVNNTQVSDNLSFLALNEVSFEVQKGEVLGILGKNGAGKSTLLKVLSRVTTPTSGEVKIKGKIVSLLEVGTGFHPELTGRENVYLNGAIMGMNKREIANKFDEIVAFAEIEKFIDTPVKRYSSGMYVRLAFSVAAHLEPDILIVDEVLAVGDADFQKKCLGKMQSVSQQDGRTVLFVSHNMEAVQRLCTSALLLNKGMVQAQGDTKAIIAEYLKSESGFYGLTKWQPDKVIGNKFARLLSVAVKDKNNEIVTEIKVTDGFRVEVNFDIFEEGNYDVHIYFSNQSGMHLFLVNDTQQKEILKKARPKGNHTSICHIPANFLNEGAISVIVAICSSPYSTHAVAENVLYFKIIDDLEQPGSRGILSQKWPDTMVRPLFKWDFKFLGNNV
jgi:lipopolysaccharide transport system ATP-binding protein